LFCFWANERSRWQVKHEVEQTNNKFLPANIINNICQPLLQEDEKQNRQKIKRTKLSNYNKIWQKDKNYKPINELTNVKKRKNNKTKQTTEKREEKLILSDNRKVVQ
jgi:hypothetical protein